jgi:predicted PolB exonuclease-like 3'-5' exonuclease
MNEDEKENLERKPQSKKRHSIGSNVINSVLNSEISKSIFKSNNKRKYRDINLQGNLNLFIANNGNPNMAINFKEKDGMKDVDNGNGSEQMLN